MMEGDAPVSPQEMLQRLQDSYEASAKGGGKTTPSIVAVDALIQSLELTCTCLCVGGERFMRLINIEGMLSVLCRILTLHEHNTHISTLAMRALALIADTVPRGSIVMGRPPRKVIPILVKYLANPTTLLSRDDLTEELLRCLSFLTLVAHRTLVESRAVLLLVTLAPLIVVHHLRMLCLRSITNLLATATPEEWKSLEEAVSLLLSNTRELVDYMFRKHQSPSSSGDTTTTTTRQPTSSGEETETAATPSLFPTASAIGSGSLSTEQQAVLLQLCQCVSHVCDRLLMSEKLLRQHDAMVAQIISVSVVLLRHLMHAKGPTGSALRSAALSPLLSIYLADPPRAARLFVRFNVFQTVCDVALNMLQTPAQALRGDTSGVASRPNQRDATGNRAASRGGFGTDSDHSSNSPSGETATSRDSSVVDSHDGGAAMNGGAGSDGMGNLAQLLLTDDVELIPLISDELHIIPLLEFLLVIIPTASRSHNAVDYLIATTPFYLWQWEDDFHNKNDCGEYLSNRLEGVYQQTWSNRSGGVAAVPQAVHRTLYVDFVNQQFVNNSGMYPHSFFRVPLIAGYTATHAGGAMKDCLCVTHSSPHKTDMDRKSERHLRLGPPNPDSGYGWSARRLDSDGYSSDMIADGASGGAWAPTNAATPTRLRDGPPPSPVASTGPLTVEGDTANAGTPSRDIGDTPGSLSRDPAQVSVLESGAGGEHLSHGSQPRFGGLGAPQDATTVVDSESYAVAGSNIAVAADNTTTSATRHVTQADFNSSLESLSQSRELVGDSSSSSLWCCGGGGSRRHSTCTAGSPQRGLLDQHHHLSTPPHRHRQHAEQPQQRPRRHHHHWSVLWGGESSRASGWSHLTRHVEKVPHRVLLTDRWLHVLGDRRTREAFLEEETLVVLLSSCVPALIAIVQGSVNPMIARHVSLLLLRCISLAGDVCGVETASTPVRRKQAVWSFSSARSVHKAAASCQRVLSILHGLASSLAQTSSFFFLTNLNDAYPILGAVQPFCAFAEDDAVGSLLVRRGLSVGFQSFVLSIRGEMRLASVNTMLLLHQLIDRTTLSSGVVRVPPSKTSADPTSLLRRRSSQEEGKDRSLPPHSSGSGSSSPHISSAPASSSAVKVTGTLFTTQQRRLIYRRASGLYQSIRGHTWTNNSALSDPLLQGGGSGSADSALRSCPADGCPCHFTMRGLFVILGDALSQLINTLRSGTDDAELHTGNYTEGSRKGDAGDAGGYHQHCLHSAVASPAEKSPIVIPIPAAPSVNPLVTATHPVNQVRVSTSNQGKRSQLMRQLSGPSGGESVRLSSGSNYVFGSVVRGSYVSSPAESDVCVLAEGDLTVGSAAVALQPLLDLFDRMQRSRTPCGDLLRESPAMFFDAASSLRSWLRLRTRLLEFSSMFTAGSLSVASAGVSPEEAQRLTARLDGATCTKMLVLLRELTAALSEHVGLSPMSFVSPNITRQSSRFSKRVRKSKLSSVVEEIMWTPLVVRLEQYSNDPSVSSASMSSFRAGAPLTNETTNEVVIGGHTLTYIPLRVKRTVLFVIPTSSVGTLASLILDTLTKTLSEPTSPAAAHSTAANVESAQRPFGQYWTASSGPVSPQSLASSNEVHGGSGRGGRKGSDRSPREAPSATQLWPPTPPPLGQPLMATESVHRRGSHGCHDHSTSGGGRSALGVVASASPPLSRPVPNAHTTTVYPGPHVSMNHLLLLVDGIPLLSPLTNVLDALCYYGESGCSLRDFIYGDVDSAASASADSPGSLGHPTHSRLHPIHDREAAAALGAALRALPFWGTAHRLQFLLLTEPLPLHLRSTSNLCGCGNGAALYPDAPKFFCSSPHIFRSLHGAAVARDEDADVMLQLVEALTTVLRQEECYVGLHVEQRHFNSALLHDIYNQTSSFMLPPLMYHNLTSTPQSGGGGGGGGGGNVVGHLATYALWNYPLLFPFEMRLTLLGLFLSFRRVLGSKALQTAIRCHRSPMGKSLLGFEWLSDKGVASDVSRVTVMVNRNDILGSAALLRRYMYCPLPLDVCFEGEQGIGTGPALEFYELLSDRLAQSDLGLWRTEPGPAGDDAPNASGPRRVSPLLYPSVRQNEATLQHFEAFGLLVARLMMIRRSCKLHLHPLFLRRLLASSSSQMMYTATIPTSTDAEASENLLLLDATLERSLRQMESMSAEDLECVEATFVLPTDEPPLRKHPLDSGDIELIPGGADVVVTAENVRQYTGFVRRWYTERVLDVALRHFCLGLQFAVNPLYLQIFSVSELDAILSGPRGKIWNSAAEFSADVVASHGYMKTSPIVQDLLAIVPTWSAELQRAFLLFVTGSGSAPLGGLPTPITVVRRDATLLDDAGVTANAALADSIVGSAGGASFDTGDKSSLSPRSRPTAADGALPTVSTCFQYLKLPQYSSRETLERQLRVAVTDGQGCFMLT